ncbi:MAG: ABC transporter ATP-binding protein [Usitatibacter sp.]
MSRISDTAIDVKGLGKKYRIRHQNPERYTALRDVIAGSARALSSWARGKGRNAAITEDFWALRDVGFRVGRGELVGIIGRNGAGKSTLLKILSQITEPTEGRVELNGRVASLLEVGTGFHPELTGRENIFLNAAIMGMKAAEIRSKFDAIVSFAEVEKFLDTPVKRYSSGMYVRLAFAVAAHMEPEILIVDEVLAVGDADFQRKCMGKMHDVSAGGRTILFVSHNMAAIKSLTTRGIVLAHGNVAYDGPSEAAIDFYAQQSRTPGTTAGAVTRGGAHTRVTTVALLDGAGKPTHQYTPGTNIRVEVTFDTDGRSGLSLELFLLDERMSKIGLASSYQLHGISLPNRAGTYRCVAELEPMWLASGRYSMDVTTSIVNSGWDHYVETALQFEVPFANPKGLPWDFKQSYGYGSQALLFAKAPVFDSGGA